MLNLKKIFPSTIRKQLIVSIAIVHAVLMSVFILDLVRRQSKFLNNQSVEWAYSLAQNISTNSVSWVLSNDIEGLNEIVGAQLSHQNLLYAMIISPGGRILAHTNPKYNGMYISDSISMQILKSKEDKIKLIENDELVDICKQIIFNGENIGWARIAISKKANYLSQRNILRNGLWYIIITILIGSILAVLIGNNITKGLHQLVAVARRVRMGDETARTSLHRNDELGQLAGDMNIMIDAMFDKQKTQMSLAEQIAHLASFRVDKETHHIQCSDEFFNILKLKQSETKLSLNDLFKLVHPEDLLLVKKEIQDSLINNQDYNSDVRFLLANDELKYINIHLKTFCDSFGTLNSIGTLLDITERKNIEKQLIENRDNLKKSNKELEEFAYVASHDLQEPLRMVSSYTKLLETRYKDKLDQDANDFIHFAIDGTVRMQGLITDLLEYSRVTTKGKPFTKVDLNSVLDFAISNLQNKIEENEASVTFDELPFCMGEEIQLTRLFQNLIDNAIKYKAKRKPIIHINSNYLDDKILISVSDNGIGIDVKHFERIFVIFQRLHSAAEYAGTGIGLAICRRIVERHGGKIWIESEIEKGTTFFFTLNK